MFNYTTPIDLGLGFKLELIFISVSGLISRIGEHIDGRFEYKG